MITNPREIADRKNKIRRDEGMASIVATRGHITQRMDDLQTEMDTLQRELDHLYDAALVLKKLDYDVKNLVPDIEIKVLVAKIAARFVEPIDNRFYTSKDINWVQAILKEIYGVIVPLNKIQEIILDE